MVLCLQTVIRNHLYLSHDKRVFCGLKGGGDVLVITTWIAKGSLLLSFKIYKTNSN